MLSSIDSNQANQTRQTHTSTLGGSSDDAAAKCKEAAVASAATVAACVTAMLAACCNCSSFGDVAAAVSVVVRLDSRRMLLARARGDCNAVSTDSASTDR